MAFITNHVFFVPDLFRGDPWDKDAGESFSDWRDRVSVGDWYRLFREDRSHAWNPFE
jgi:hypothetical protein